ncbi:DUF3331 domain-containing protein [Burkholderia metallica]|uniref:DUF3331 domain-containing protein n=1 Tax=Burkholderia metallica TaxID=488729 RepID=UPI001589DAC1|nr:DUF3331 domain-containing protein [Burkholderia metallica]
MRNPGHVFASIAGHVGEPERSDDSPIGRARPVPFDEIEPAERWQRIMHSLTACSDSLPFGLRRKDYAADIRQKMTLAVRSTYSATIDFLDRPTSGTVVLSWRDSTGGHYGYQSWHKGCARRTGTCAASGMPIHPGDEIFRPSARNGRPTNWSAMILALHIARIDFARITK